MTRKAGPPHPSVPLSLRPSVPAHQCRDALTVRQKLISQDYRVSYSLAKACKLDLRKQRCNLDSNLPRAREARLSYLLLCLEAAVHRGECSQEQPADSSPSLRGRSGRSADSVTRWLHR